MRKKKKTRKRPNAKEILTSTYNLLTNEIKNRIKYQKAFCVLSETTDSETLAGLFEEMYDYKQGIKQKR